METKNNMREEITRVFIIVAVVSLAAHHGTAAERIKTHLVGRDGLCLDSGGPSRYNFPKLAPCKPNEDTQLWTFPNDSTVRWTNDRCLFPYGMEVLKQYILVKTGECNELQHEDKTWAFDEKNGFLVHVHSGLVLTVRTNSNFVNVEANRNDPSQIWAPIVYQDHQDPAPRVGHIMGLHSYECLGSSKVGQVVLWLRKCSIDETNGDLWALFDDGTIRVNANRKLCMTSFPHSRPYRHIISAVECEGKAEQRWEIDLDKFTIHHPNDSTLVMDVIKYENGELKSWYNNIVALFTPNGASTQQWTFIE